MLNRLQRQLERIYEVDSPLEVEDCLITDEHLLRRFETDRVRPAPEKLIVHENGAQVDVGLFIRSDIVSRLDRDDPVQRLHDGNLADLCTALEGVSHFLYLTWNASFDRGVSQLELEIQAEVDKYAAAAFLFGQQRRSRVPAGLLRWLFRNPSFDPGLDAQERARYVSANHYAGKFCSRLENRYLREKRSGNMVNDLRRFYRLSQRAKIAYIESTTMH